MAFISEDMLMLRKGKHAQSLGHCGPRPRAVEISRKIPSRMFLYIPYRLIWKDTGLMDKLPLSLNTCATLQKKKKKKKGSQRDRDSDFYNSSFLQTTYLSNSAKYHSRHHSLLISRV